MKYYTIINILFTLVINNIIIVTILNLLTVINSQSINPCPKVLAYTQNGYGDTIGIIEVDNFYTNNINELTVRTTSNSPFSKATLQPIENSQGLVNTVESGNPIYYKLITEDGSIPIVLDILSNGETICSSRRDRLSSIFTVTNSLTIQSGVRNSGILLRLNGNSQIDNVFTNPLNRGRPVSRTGINPWPSTPSNPNQRPQSPFPKEPPSTIFNFPSTNQNSIFRESTSSNPYERPQPSFQIQSRESTASNQNPIFRESTPSNRNERPQPSFQSTASNQNPISSEICGTATMRLPLIFNGQTFQPGSWPWLTALFKKSSNSFGCGGSLVSHKTVVTAAHCVISGTESDYMIGIGVYNLSQRFEEGATFESIESFHIHPQYNISSTANHADIAIVTLERSIKYNSKIKPICLWSTSTDFNRVVNKIGIVAGWGLKDPEGTQTRDTPTYTKARIVSYIDCIVSNPSIFSQTTSNTTLCAGFRNGTGPCSGDSGSGLMVEENGKWYLTGIVSEALHDRTTLCKLDDYAMYTNALKLIEWIQRFIIE